MNDIVQYIDNDDILYMYVNMILIVILICYSMSHDNWSVNMMIHDVQLT